MNTKPNTDTPPLRVLLIVDSLYWVIGNFAKQIKTFPTPIHATICSQFSLRKTIKRFGNLSTPFDVIHFMNDMSFNPFEGKLPTVTTFHHRDSKTKMQQFFESAAVMTVSKQWRDYLIEKGIPHEDIFQIPFGVDTNTFCQPKEGEIERIRTSLKIPVNALVIGFSGKPTSNCDGRKGLDCFSQGIHQLHSRHPNMATLLIGPGWHQFAKKLRNDGIFCTHISYKIDHKQIAQLYRALDIFWVTSRIEGGPVPLLEAMASGLPCISTPVGAALDLIESEKNGFFVPFNSPEEFVKISLDLLNDRILKKRIGKEARQTIVQKRQWNQSKEKVTHLYECAIQKFHSRQAKEQPTLRKEKAFSPEMNTQPEEPMQILEFSSSKVQNWMKACEEINGIKMMTKTREWKAAGRFGLKALRTNPFDPMLWKEILLAVKKSQKSRPLQLT